MSTVTELSRFRGLVRVSLDGTSWITIKQKHFALLPLEEGSDVETDDYLNRMAALQAKDCFEAALSMLDRAAQTRGNIRSSLVRKGFVADAVDAAIQRLEELRLIDDTSYAARLAQTQSSKAVGVYAVKRKLRAKQLSEEDVDAALSIFDDAQQQQACRKAAEKLYKKYANLPDREARAKLSQALARRGFGWDAIRECIDALINGWDDDA